MTYSTNSNSSTVLNSKSIVLDTIKIKNMMYSYKSYLNRQYYYNITYSSKSKGYIVANKSVVNKGRRYLYQIRDNIDWTRNYSISSISSKEKDNKDESIM